jgi:inner membrane protein
MRFPLLGKVAALGAVALALMAALSTVSGIVNEREGRLREAEQSVMDGLATQQTLVGPVLQRQCEESWNTEQGEGKERRVVRMQRELNIVSPPKNLEMKGHSLQEPRYRGLFKVNAYTLKAQLMASWKPGDLQVPAATMPNGVVVCKAPVLWVAVGDARGVRKASLRVNDTEVAVLPSTQQNQHPRGLHAIVPAQSYAPTSSTLTAHLEIDLVGTVQWAIAPVADNNQITLTSNWPHPSFAGRFLPVQREVSEQGFSAQWQVSALASSAQQQLTGGGGACRLDGVSAAGYSPASASNTPNCIETLGVNFIDPVSSYVLSDRAAKYGLLFIALTFVGVALVEVQRRLRVHPIQYLLVGCALAVFFLLLVSLSEHLPFAGAYAAASTACTLLLAFYGRFVLRGTKQGLAFGAAIATLYGALFVLLQLEQSALVLGSVLLFVVLAALMAATRHIDWYAFTAHLRQEEAVAK